MIFNFHHVAGIPFRLRAFAIHRNLFCSFMMLLSGFSMRTVARALIASKASRIDLWPAYVSTPISFPYVGLHPQQTRIWFYSFSHQPQPTCKPEDCSSKPKDAWWFLLGTRNLSQTCQSLSGRRLSTEFPWPGSGMNTSNSECNR